MLSLVLYQKYNAIVISSADYLMLFLLPKKDSHVIMEIGNRFLSELLGHVFCPLILFVIEACLFHK